MKSRLLNLLTFAISLTFGLVLAVTVQGAAVESTNSTVPKMVSNDHSPRRPPQALSAPPSLAIAFTPPFTTHLPIVFKNGSPQSDPIVTTLVDTAAPTVTLTAPPDGATLSGVVTVSADASDDVGVEGVWFKLDGKNLGAEDTALPWAVQWDTVTILNGTYTLTAVARDAAGNQTTSAPITVTVFNQNTDIDYALRFFGNGTNDIDRLKIQIDDPGNSDPGPPADVGLEDFTLEFWMRARTSENTASAVTCGNNINWINGNIIVDRDRFNQDRDFGLSIAGGMMVFGVSGDGTGDRTICGVTNVLDDAWHHVAIQRRRSDGWMWLYVDGNLEAEADGPDGDLSYPDDGLPGNFCGPGGNQPCTNSDPYLVIGAEKHDAGSQLPSYSGWFDELRLSNSLRYTSTFSPPSAPFISDANTIALYSLNEGQNDVINDASGAVGGPSNGVRNYGGDPAGPVWVSEAPFGPKVTIDTPVEGETITGTTITINYQPFGNLTEVDHIHFQLDNGPERPDYDLDGFYQFSNVAPGPHTIYAYLVRSNHLHITELIDAQVSFENVPDPSDPIPPTVSITYPSSGMIISGTINIDAIASDDVSMGVVEFYLDGNLLSIGDANPPYSIVWNSTTVPDGQYVLTAEARDTAGNSTVSASVAILVANTVPPDDPAIIGQWSAPFGTPIIAIHNLLFHTDEVLLWDDPVAPNNATLWNWQTGQFTTLPNASDQFCAGQVTLSDGRGFIVGGQQEAFVGVTDGLIFDPVSASWISGTPMTQRRWYPTATTLQDGRVLALSGSVDDGIIADIPEIYDPATDSWTRLDSASLDVQLYPFIFLLSDGRILYAGSDEINTETYTLDINTQTWTMIDPVIVPGGSAAMYRPGQVIKAGSPGNVETPPEPATNTAHVIDMNQASPSWRQVGSMAFPRAYHTLTILPDGDVIVTSGVETTNEGDSNLAVYTAEIWSPETETWSTMAEMDAIRTYHSTALLLPDGRVLVTGSGRLSGISDEFSAQIFSPPYLFKGARPTITVAPEAVQYNSSFFVETPDGADIASVAFIRPGGVTHGFDQNQRYVPVTFQQTADGLNIDAPTDGFMAPPGYYMLFLVNSNGVPSVAEFVRVEEATTQPPLATDDTGTTDEDIAVTLDVLANDSDPDGDPLTVSNVTQGSQGAVTINFDNTVTYTPNPDFNGADAFTYTVIDGNGGSDIAIVTITINPIEDPPLALDDSATTPHNTPLVVNVLANDTDPDGDPLTVSNVTQGANGTVVNNGDGTLTYTPNPGYNGPDSLTYTIEDGNGGTDTATVSITVYPANDPPLANDDTATTDEDTAIIIDVLGNDTDPDSDPLTLAGVTPGNNGATVLNPDNTVTYTPDPNFNGSDAFSYTADDGNGGTDTATVTITINPVNDPPVADDQALTTPQDTSVDITLTATDIEGNPLTFNVVAPPANGTLSGLAPNLTYTPNSGYTGPDAFTFTANDGLLDSNVATITVEALPQTGMALEFDGLDDIAQTVDIPSSAEFTVEAWVQRTVDTGDYQSFLSDANSSYGQVFFTLYVDGSNSDCGTNPVNQFAYYDGEDIHCSSVTADLNTWHHIAVTRDASGARRFFVDGLLRSTQNNTPDPPNSNGVLTLGRAGDFNGEYFAGLLDEIRISNIARYSSDFTPPTSPLAADQNTVALYHLDEGSGQIVTDSSGNGRDGTLGSNATVQSSDPIWSTDSPVSGNPNQPPLADDQSVTTAEDTAVALTLTATDPDGDPLTYSLNTPPTNGTLTGSPPDLLYSPNPDFNGGDIFTFTANDGTTDSNLATVSITVNPVNDPPVADDQSTSTQQDTLLNIILTATDIEGNPLTFNVVAPPANGTLSGLAPNLTYTPNSGYTGPDAFTFTANDGLLDSNVATVSMTVTQPDLGPSLETGVIQGVSNTGWTTVTLGQTYTSMVVVGSANYDNTTVPLVVRLRNAVGNSFEVRLDRTDGSATAVNGVDVHYLVVEEGVYTEALHGVTMEAVKFVSTVTDRKGSWVGQNRTYNNSYTNPIVVGQVMTDNDPDFSVFWSRGSSRNTPPSSTQLWVGKHVGEDADTTRLDETIGYLVIEAGSGLLGTTSYVAGLGTDTVRGVGNAPPYSYPLTGLSSASTAIVSQMAMDGNDGGWAILYGPNPVTASNLGVAIDEDQARNSERSHTTEQVSYIVFD